MAYDQKMAKRVRNALANLEKLEEKTMFGSVGFMVRGKLCICVRQNNVMYKVGKDIADEAVTTKAAEPVIMQDRLMKAWVYVDNSKLQQMSEFEKWSTLALDFNKS